MVILLRRYLLPGLCIAVLVLALHAMTIASGIPSELAVETLEFRTTDGGRHAFRVHVADTPASRSRGLMYVTRLERLQGMLFDFGESRPVSMWMKNTPLSLDMVFVGATGEVLRIEPRTTPFSTEYISSGVTVRAVVELLGGTCERLGIAPGDRVIHRLFDVPAAPAAPAG